MDSNFQISDIKDRRITTGEANHKEILQRESHMRNKRWKTSKNTSMTELSKPRGFGSGYSKTNDDVKRCHQCGSDQHLVRDCDKAKGNQNTQGTRSTYQRPNINKIQVTSTDDVSEVTETKKVMKCGVNLKPNYQEIMPEQIVVKQTVKKEESNALKKIQLKHVAVEIRGKETEKGSIIKVNALSDSGAEIPVISEELIEGMNLEQVGEVSIQGVAGEVIPAKLVKVDVRICETPSDTDEENRTNQVKFTITPYVCACVAGMGSKEKFLLHPVIIAELKAIPQVIIKREEEVKANVITRAQRLQKEREEAKASDEEEREDEGKNENESESDEASDDESSVTSDRIRQENDACGSDNLLESEDSDEDMWDNGLPIANLFEEAEEDGEQVMQRADAEKFE